MKFTERIVQQLEQAEAVDGVAGPLADVVGKVFPAGPVKDFLSGTWLDHPLHPAAVAIPIGTLVSVSALDFLGGDKGGKARRRLLALGILSSLPAAAAGASDWSDTTEGEKRIGLVHA